VIAITHASLDTEMAVAMLDLGAFQRLVELAETLPPSLDTCVGFALEALRNLSFQDHDALSTLPNGFVSNMWDAALHDQVRRHCFRFPMNYVHLN
jgi:hypothetical protein